MRRLLLELIVTRCPVPGGGVWNYHHLKACSIAELLDVYHTFK